MSPLLNSRMGREGFEQPCKAGTSSDGWGTSQGTSRTQGVRSDRPGLPCWHLHSGELTPYDGSPSLVSLRGTQCVRLEVRRGGIRCASVFELLCDQLRRLVIPRNPDAFERSIRSHFCNGSSPRVWTDSSQDRRLEALPVTRARLLGGMARRVHGAAPRRHCPRP
jgi:hypothetical protein